MRPFPLLLIVTTLWACAAPTPTTTTPAPLAPAISVDELRRDLHAFAADSFLGREAGTPSATRAAQFIAQRLITLGVEPAGDSLYYHRVPLLRNTLGPGTRFEVARGQNTMSVALGSEIVPFVSIPGAPPTKRTAEGDVYFAGFGLSRADFEGVRDAGKIIVILHGAPPTVTDSAERKRLESQQELGQRIGRAYQFRPAAIAILMTGGARDFYTQAVPELMRSVTTAPGDQTTSDAQRPFPMILLGLPIAGSPLVPANWPTDATPQALPGRFTGRVDLRTEPFTSYNVVGIVRGTDPRLNKTYVAYGAHLDHIGIQPGMAPDSIANGADDDGSGSVAMLAIAKAMSANRPRRSALFVWHTAEEKGLLGSAYFVDHPPPTVPIDSIVAHLNSDMIGRRGGPTSTFNSATEGAAAANRLYIVGPNAAPNNQSKALGAVLDSVNARQVQPLQFDREWDSPTHPEQIYFRSDHYSYARKGVPVLFFTTGLHEDYHKVSDEAQKIDYDKLSRISALLLELGMTLGNREARPR